MKQDEEKQLSDSEEVAARKALLDAISEKPSTYWIDVLDASMLPENLKKKKELKFVIKPPVFESLQKIAEISLSVPEDVRMGKVSGLMAIKYSKEICDILAILCHGSSKGKMPKWYSEFFIKNLTPIEALQIWQESMLKLRTDFFLPFFQSAEALNPMSMTRKI